MQARYDAAQPAGGQASGRRRRPAAAVPARGAWRPPTRRHNEVYAEIGAGNPDFKKIYDRMTAFRNDQYLWWQVAEFSFDSFMIRASRARAEPLNGGLRSS